MRKTKRGAAIERVKRGVVSAAMPLVGDSDDAR